MPIFYYRAVDAAGQIVQGSLEAKGDRSVVQQLHQNKLIPLSISQGESDSTKTSLRPLSFLRRVGLSDIVQFSQEMAVLLNAGLPLDRSLQIILEVTKKPVLRAMLEQIWRDMQAGKSLSEAMSRQRVFSPLYISLVKAGETGGFLEITFQRLGEYLTGLKELKNHVVTALIYPMILGLVGGLSIILMLIFVVPRFEVFFKEMGQGLFLEHPDPGAIELRIANLLVGGPSAGGRCGIRSMAFMAKSESSPMGRPFKAPDPGPGKALSGPGLRLLCQDLGYPPHQRRAPD